MYRVALLALAGAFVTAAGGANVDSVPAFPGAEGFGAGATGGRGGQVLFVTSTEDDAKNPQPGTLRWACEKVQGPRYILFRTGGVIQLKKQIRLSESNVTLAAQTAPGAGICLQGSFLDIDHARNVIVRGLRVRAGDGPGSKGRSRDCLDITCADTVIVDHCSLTWSVDEIMDISDWEGPKQWGECRNVTVQWCLLGEGLHKSIHGLDPDGSGAEHSAAVLVNGKNTRNVSFHHNLLAHNDHRNPLLTGGVSIEFVNNVIYDWGQQPCNINNRVGHAGDLEVDAAFSLIGNSWIHGPSSEREKTAIVANKMTSRGAVFLQDNCVVNNLADIASQDQAKLISMPRRADDKPAIQSALKPEPGVQSTARVLDMAGAVAPLRDAVDARIVKDVRQGSGKVINSQSEVGGWPEYPKGTAVTDSDNDGMPDEWEKAHGLDPNKPNATGHELDKGYDNLEIYLNSLFDAKPQR